MKAVQFSTFGNPYVLQIVDIAMPHVGPRQVRIRIRVRAAGINASDWKKRQGLLDPILPQTMGYEAAGIVDEVGEGVTNIKLGDSVFGFCTNSAAQAEYAVLTYYSHMPASLDFPSAAALPVIIETAARVLDQLNVVDGTCLLINGASGNIGAAAIQLALVRGARVIGIASPAKCEYIRSLGAEPVSYGPNMTRNVLDLVPSGVDRVLDVAGNGVLSELISLAAKARNVITISDLIGAQTHNVRFSKGDDGRALYILAQIDSLIEAGKFSAPAVQCFPLTKVAKAYHIGETGQALGKLILTIDPCSTLVSNGTNTPNTEYIA